MGRSKILNCCNKGKKINLHFQVHKLGHIQVGMLRAPYLLFKVSFLGPRVVPILYYAKRVEEEMCGNILTGMAVPCQSNIGKLINRNAFVHFLEYRYSKLFKHNAFKSTYIRYFQFQASMDTLLDRY